MTDYFFFKIKPERIDLLLKDYFYVKSVYPAIGGISIGIMFDQMKRYRESHGKDFNELLAQNQKRRDKNA